MTVSSRESVIVGIDLGTTNSGIAVWDDKKQKPVIIPIRDADVTPSILAMQDGDILIGNPAKESMDEMEAAVTLAKTHKRDMGTETKITFGGQEVYPYELAGYFLGALKQQAEDYLQKPLKRAVITVPAYFTQTAVEDTKKAGEMAGFAVEALLSEPTAAALAFGHRAAENTKLLVYDLGGGTFDVSVIEAIAGEFIVRANYGDRYLGGDDFDILLRDLILQRSGYGDLLESDATADRNFLQKFITIVEKAKILLSTAGSIQVRENYCDSQGREIEIDFKLTRDIFEHLIKDKIDQTINCCYKALEKAQVDIKEIKDILLVGGSSKIPFISSKIRQSLGFSDIQQIDPITCVTQGAAIHTCSLNWVLEGQKFRLEAPWKPSSPTAKQKVEVIGKLRPNDDYKNELDLTGMFVRLASDEKTWNDKMVNPNGGFAVSVPLQKNKENVLSLNVFDPDEQAVEQFAFNVVHDESATEKKVIKTENVIPYPFSVGLEGRTKIYVLLKEQSPLPSEGEKAFSLLRDKQTKLVVPIYEGDDPLPERNRLLGRVCIENLPSTLNQDADVIVHFQMTKDRILQVRVEVPDANEEQTERINVSRDFEKPADIDQVLDKLEKTINQVTKELDERLSILPPEHRPRIGFEDSRLRTEATEAIKNQEIGKLEANKEQLVNLLQEVDKIIPDRDLVNKFREDSKTANFYVIDKDVTSVDQGTVYDTIRAGEDAIRKADNEALKKSYNELQILLNRMFEDINIKLTMEDKLRIWMREYETLKGQLTEKMETYRPETLVENQNINPDGIIRKEELGEVFFDFEAFKEEVYSYFGKGDFTLNQAKELLESPNTDNEEAMQLFSRLMRVCQTLEDFLKKLLGEYERIQG